MSEQQCKHLDPNHPASRANIAEAGTVLFAPKVGGPFLIQPGVFEGVRLCAYCLGIVHGTLLLCVGEP